MIDTQQPAWTASGPVPPRPRTYEDLGLPVGVVADLALKVLYFHGSKTGRELADHLCIPFTLMEPAIKLMTDAAYCESSGIRRTAAGDVNVLASVQWQLSHGGRERARELLDINQYAGPAPVPVTVYAAVAEHQTSGQLRVTEADLREALGDLVLGSDVIEALGAALNGHHPLFLYGAPGNGKSSIADDIAHLLGPPLFVPRALYAHGEIVRFFDPVYHVPCTDPDIPEHDRRWVLVERPAVKVGGELAAHTLELSFDPRLGFYEASAQLKANGGLFLVDDFGRQTRIPANELLNRLIVPLGKGLDYLNIARAGTTIAVPFTTRLVLATNLQPEQLMDEAFLRRIRVKVLVPNPTEEQFRQIWRTVCERAGVEWRPEVIDGLVARHYRAVDRPFRGVHPTDLLSQMVSMARFRGREPRLDPELLEAACATYFVRSG